jgi:UPF0148 protein
MDSEKDQKVKRIARFLELGGTMLAEHCNVCGAPKFRYQGTVICPICDVREEGEAPEQAVKAEVPEPTPSTEKDRSSFETKKRVQAHRQKPRFGFRSSEAAVEEEKTSVEEEKTSVEEEKTVEPLKEEISPLSSQKEEAKVPVPETLEIPAASKIQAASSRRSQKPVAVPKVSRSHVSGAHEDRKVLENLLFNKMVNIADFLQDETDPRSIAEDLELIEKGIGIIERLRQL